MMLLVETRGLRWTLLFLFSAVIFLQGQDDLANQALDFMRANRFHDAEMLWRQLETRNPNNAAVHSNLGVCLAQR